jgi:HEAT repeat protein
MITLYCPACYAANPENAAVCQKCGANLREAPRGNWTERLIWGLQHPEPTVAPRVAWILGERRDAAAVRPLLALIERTRELGALEEAATALGKIGDPAAVPALADLLRTSFVSVRVRAAEALGAIGGAAAEAALREALADPSAHVREACGAALQKLHATRGAA